MANDPRQPVGPLTSIFTPPSSCLQIITSGLGSNWAESSSLFIGNFGGNYRSAASSCYPGTTVRITFGSVYYWSPAYSEYCPVGYRTACQYAGAYFVSSTASICCPIGYSCDGGNHLCSSTISNTAIPVFVATDPTVIPSALSTITLDGLHTVWNDGIPLVWDMKFDSFLISSLSSVHAQTGSTASASQPSSTRESSATSSTYSGSGLSTGAKAGIGVGAGFVCLLAMGMLFLFYRNRRSRNTARPDASVTERENMEDARRYVLNAQSPRELDQGRVLVDRRSLSELRDKSTVPDVELPT